MDFFHPKAKVNKNHAKKNKKYKDLLQQVSKENQKLFEELVNTGKMIENFAKEEDLVSLENLIEKNKKNLTYLSCFVKEAFLSALFFKYYDTVKYFLENGLNLLDENFKDCLLVVCRISKFTVNDLPIELLDLLLSYGADPNYSEQDKFKTPLHIACKNGMTEFAISLISKGNAEVNPVDKNKKTPLNYIDDKMKKGKKFGELYNYMESKGGQLDWRV